MKEFIKDILKKDYPDIYEKLFSDSDVLKYLDLKTSAVNKNVKSRKSLANIYAIYALLEEYIGKFYEKPEDYKKFDGFEYTELLKICRSQYGGEKIQNHALNSRLNLEFDNKAASLKNKGKYIVIQKNKKYLMNIDYIYTDGKDLSKSIIEIIDEYVRLLRKKDDDLIGELEKLQSNNDSKEISKEISDLLLNDSEARVFEIVSFAILKNYYEKTNVLFGYSKDTLVNQSLTLYKTGRTNANDGGIDFVMRPLGRFFQVTEVGEFDKYFLDVDKVLHYPMTFVVKTQKTKQDVKNDYDSYIKAKCGGNVTLEKKYESSIEDIITINELSSILNSLSEEEVKSILKDIVQYYKVEMNFSE